MKIVESHGFMVKEAEDYEDVETRRIDVRREVDNDKVSVKRKRLNTDHIDGLQDGDDESSKEEGQRINLKREAAIDKLPIKRKRLNADHVDGSDVTKLAREINSNDGDLSKSKANLDVFCKDCVGFPALCKSPCFMKYHTTYNI